ncbi:MAG: hypothetical protein ACLR6J_14440 [Parabacteroides merdae]
MASTLITALLVLNLRWQPSLIAMHAPVAVQSPTFRHRAPAYRNSRHKCRRLSGIAIAIGVMVAIVLSCRLSGKHHPVWPGDAGEREATAKWKAMANLTAWSVRRKCQTWPHDGDQLMTYRQSARLLAMEAQEGKCSLPLAIHETMRWPASLTDLAADLILYIVFSTDRLKARIRKVLNHTDCSRCPLDRLQQNVPALGLTRRHGL